MSYICCMKFFLSIFILLGFIGIPFLTKAQCSICTKTAQQLGDGPAAGMNTGIIYLGLVPLIIVGFIGYRWWKNEKLHKNHK
mgnify:FL=1